MAVQNLHISKIMLKHKILWTSNYEALASPWQQGRENSTRDGENWRGEEEDKESFSFFSRMVREKNESWRELQLPVSIAMWMQDKWRERERQTMRERLWEGKMEKETEQGMYEEGEEKENVWSSEY